MWPYSQLEQQRFSLLSFLPFCVDYALHGVFYTLTEQILFLVFSEVPGSEYLYLCCCLFGAVNTMNIMISWFVLTLDLSARLHNVGLSICSDCKMLENQSANLQTNSGLKGSIFFVQKKVLKFKLLFHHLLWRILDNSLLWFLTCNCT